MRYFAAQPCMRRRLMSLWMEGWQGTEGRLVDGMAREKYECLMWMKSMKTSALGRRGWG